MYVRLCFVTLCVVLGAFSSPIAKRDGTVDTIKNSITSIHTGMKSVDALITAFQNSGGSILQGLNIHSAATSLAQAIESATSEANASDSFSETDSNGILNLMATVVPDIQQTLTNLGGRKPALAGLLVPGVNAIVLRDLQSLKQNSDALTAALLAKTPAAVMSAAQEQSSLVNAVFSSVIATYSS